MQRADEFTVNNLGIAQEDLIISAGKAVAFEIAKKKKGGRVLVVCGIGNNGKDGLVIADELKKIHGFSVYVYEIKNPKTELFNKEYDIIVDCVFGTGLTRKVQGEYARIIEKMNNMSGFKVACDIPSGINADTGKVMGVAFKSDLTVSIQEYKRGHFFNDGIDYSKKTVLKDIGISIWGEFPYKLNDEDLVPFFKKRERNANKGTYKKSCVIGGSKDYFGAPTLSLNSLLTMCLGSGYGYLAVPNTYIDLYKGLNLECIVKPFSDDKSNMVLDKDFTLSLNEYSSVAIGMGLGVTEGVYEELCDILSNYTGNLIIDADGINVLARYGLEPLKTAKCNVLLTPHLKEFSRLINVDVEKIKDKTVEYAVDFAKEYNVAVCVKSSVSVITDGEKVCVNTAGSPCLAKAGSGDILSGIIAGIATRENLFDSASIGAFVLGRSGEFAEKELGDYSVTATMLPTFIGKYIAYLQA